MKLGVAQIRCTLGDTGANCRTIDSYTAEAARQGCCVVVFPEMSDVGYEEQTIRRHAAAWTDLPFQTLQRSARENSIYIVCGLSEKTDAGFYNCAAVVSPGGRILRRYHKIHLFPGTPFAEPSVFTAGDTLATAEIDGLLFGFSICFDLRYPEMYRALTLAGASVLVNCAAWPNVRSAHWQTLARARAIENQAYFVGANRVGTDGQCTFAGLSCIISPWGELLALADEAGEQLLTAELDPAFPEQARSSIPVLSGRRSEIY